MKLSDLRIMGYHLYYGFDPHTGGRSLYLWSHRRKQVVRKLITTKFCDVSTERDAV